jgi:hypothetical protein
MIAIPAHLRKISGDEKIEVYSTQESSQLVSFRLLLALPGIPTFIAFQTVRVFVRCFGPIPAALGFAWDDQCSVVCEVDGDLNFFEDLGEDFIFVSFGVLDKDRVMYLQEQLTYPKAPNLEHTEV